VRPHTLTITTLDVEPTPLPYGSLIGGALALDPRTFLAYASDGHGATLALVILLLSGLSNALGQSVALFASRARPWRFALGLLTGALVFTLSVVVWGLALDVAARLLLGRDVAFTTLVRVVGLAHAPRLFSFLTFTPYFGSGIGVILTLWTYLALAIGARATLGLERIDTLLVLGAAWLLSEAIARLVGRPIVALTRRIRPRIVQPRAPRGARTP